MLNWVQWIDCVFFFFNSLNLPLNHYEQIQKVEEDDDEMKQNNANSTMKIERAELGRAVQVKKDPCKC